MRHLPERRQPIGNLRRGLAPQHRDADEIRGQVRGGRRPLIVHAVSAVSDRKVARGNAHLTGWGYLATDGTYGCGKIPQFANAGDIDTTTPLRAVWHAIAGRLADERLTVATDSPAAARILKAWQSGSTQMPARYTGRSKGGPPTLELLRREVATHAGNLTVRQVRRDDETLTIGAATLARLGLRWAAEALTEDDVQARAVGLAEGFIADWKRR